MPAVLNFFDTYMLLAITEEIVPQQTFFKDRYFPTGANDIFRSDKVLTEYRKGDRKMAAFVSARAGDIPPPCGRKVRFREYDADRRTRARAESSAPLGQSAGDRARDAQTEELTWNSGRYTIGAAPRST